MSDSLNVRWEYTVLYINTERDFEEGKEHFIKSANGLGQEGWEFTGTLRKDYFIFRRRLP